MQTFLVAVFGILCGPQFWQGEPTIVAKEPELIITGAVEAPVTLRASQLARLRHRVVSGKRRDGMPTQFEGVLLKDALELAGVRFGDSLKGDRMSMFLLAESADGYRVVFALPELDPSFTDKVVLLAMLQDGIELSSREGPFRIIIPDEKKQARSIKQLKMLRLLRSEDAVEE